MILNSSRNYPQEIDRRMLDELISIASQAAAAILTFSPDNISRHDKVDGSPVTAADEAAQAVILRELETLLPGMPVVSEEAAVPSVPPPIGARFILVDPLDGTREFVAGLSEYTVNIALIDDGKPIAGVIAAPALGIVWAGVVGHGAERLGLTPGAKTKAAKERIEIRARAQPKRNAVALISRSHRDPETDAYLDRLAPMERMACGSSLKFCRIAEGVADIYARLASISEWDVAAGHAIVAAAGGTVRAIDGQPLVYGQPSFRLPPFVASGDGAAIDRTD